MPLPRAGSADMNTKAPRGVERNMCKVIGAGLPVVVTLGPLFRRKRKRHVADIGGGRMDAGCDPDTCPATLRPQLVPGFFPPFMAHGLKRVVQAAVIVASVVIAAGRRPVGKFVRFEEIAASYLDRVDPRLPRNRIH